MKSFTQRVAFLFITLSVVNASRWWRDTGYDDALDGDAPEPQATQPPKQIFQGAVYPGIPPLNRTTGSGIYNLLNARQETPGCGVCNPITFVSSTPVCCNNGTYCCATGNLCQDEGWCCPRGKRACPGVRNGMHTGTVCC
ncbi:hypothetical protein M408DRAFT_278113 [Serendipita vermifera MAFF 305830]|uniref:Granulins domain-containing protein n=1 Tax=Serendipita vermifera MAFF 305830 TaxID=933852 RepID=A0A0C2WZV4_SERVB|nr:hypothetical protein M408DRAFT_278113 [Serendipita vermifera MAFF 305830]